MGLGCLLDSTWLHLSGWALCGVMMLVDYVLVRRNIGMNEAEVR